MMFLDFLHNIKTLVNLITKNLIGYLFILMLLSFCILILVFSCPLFFHTISHHMHILCFPYLIFGDLSLFIVTAMINNSWILWQIFCFIIKGIILILLMLLYSLQIALVGIIHCSPTYCAVLRKGTLACPSYLVKGVHFTVFVLIHTNLVSWKVLPE